mgnify:CR=1 FL=1
MDGGAEAIIDTSELAQVRRQARKVHLKALIAATGLVALTLIVPS